MPRLRYVDILRRIQARVVEEVGPMEDRRHKAIYGDERVRITKDQWNRKWSGEVKFSFDEIERLADFFHAPRHWPYLPMDEAHRLAAADPPERQQNPGAAVPPGQSGRRTRGGRR